jgi:kinesin family protein 6/9
MAYGQTGAGKTFTMTGDCANFKQRGVTPRAIGQLFEDILERSQYEFKVSVSYMEIYNEKVFDLLDSSGGQTSSSDFAVVEDPATRSMHVRGLTQMPVSVRTNYIQHTSATQRMIHPLEPSEQFRTIPTLVT